MFSILMIIILIVIAFAFFGSVLSDLFLVSLFVVKFIVYILSFVVYLIKIPFKGKRIKPRHLKR